MDLSPEMQSLLTKLDALDLTEGERSEFGRLLGVGTGDEAHEVEGFGAMASPTSPGAGRRGITVQGFNLFDTFPIHVVAPGSKPGSGVVDHKSED